MLQIQDTLVSLDLIEKFFCCDLDACLGQCCVEGDAGAPITEEEKKRLEEVLPIVEGELLPSSKDEIARTGVSYVDEEGDLVTSIVNGGNCVFATFGPNGMCHCAVEKACRAGKISFLKPESCYLYPVRLKRVGDFTALNFHRWKICSSAEKLGRRLGLRAYQFLKDPLIARFGQEWYDELCETAEAYIKEYCDK